MRQCDAGTASTQCPQTLCPCPPFPGSPRGPLSDPDFPCPLAHIARFSPAVLVPLLTMPRPAPGTHCVPHRDANQCSPNGVSWEPAQPGHRPHCCIVAWGSCGRHHCSLRRQIVPLPCPAASPVVLQLPHQGFAPLKRLALLGSPHVLARAGATTPAWQCGQGCALCSDGAHVVLSQLSP